MRILLNLILLLVSAINCQDVEHFSSLVQLERLGVQESQLIATLEALVEELDDDYVKSKLEYFRFEGKLFRQDAAKYIANPLNAFAMIKRATVDLSLLIERLPQQLEALARYRTKQSSLTHAVKCLLLIQRLYKLPTDDIARGVIHNRRIGDRMTPNDLFVIGTVAADELKGEEYLAREYLEHALKGHDRLNELHEERVLMKITNLCERLRDYKGAALHLKQLLMKDPDNLEAAEYAMKIVKLFQAHGSAGISSEDDPFNAKFTRDGKYSRRKEFELMGEVCRGELERKQPPLHCRFHSSAPFVRFKVEEVNREPLIVLYIDVLSDGEIQSLKRAAGGDAAELYDKDHEQVARISRRIEAMTGLAVDASEPLTVQHFGAGGPVWEPARQRTMATVLFYMNDDHMDGYTAFPYLKVRVEPKAGSALFWFTRRHSGSYEYATRFTQCPVTYRSKWMAIKHLSERGQEFRRPCVPPPVEETTLEDYDAIFF